MMQFINQYSFVLMAIIVFFVLLVYFLRNGLGQRELIALAALLLGVAVAIILFNPGDSTLSDDETPGELIGSGTPILIEFQSPY
jgi:energy-coupling factor transporter transmembrane protein EcfT